ncbi:Ss18-Like Protein 2 [Manis pentadactyla]|nr:Ss18-Like Protein 2 [Manis pentadactyla]
MSVAFVPDWLRGKAEVNQETIQRVSANAGQEKGFLRRDPQDGLRLLEENNQLIRCILEYQTKTGRMSASSTSIFNLKRKSSKSWATTGIGETADQTLPMDMQLCVPSCQVVLPDLLPALFTLLRNKACLSMKG